MNFREYVTITEDFTNKTLEELELLLAHHLEDLEEYKDSDISAYDATLQDIKAIKSAIKKLSKNEKKPVTTGNQDLSSADTISIGGSGNMAAASPDSAGAGQGNAE